MKIDEESINHNAVKQISEFVESRYEMLADSNERVNYDYLIMTVGEIAGICEFAEALKEVLRS